MLSNTPNSHSHVFILHIIVLNVPSALIITSLNALSILLPVNHPLQRIIIIMATSCLTWPSDAEDRHLLSYTSAIYRPEQKATIGAQVRAGPDEPSRAIDNPRV